MAAAPTLPAPAILDIEASGFGHHSYPIEVGFVLGDGRSYCSLIRPAPGWTHWDAEAERVHHIPLDRIRRHGREALEVAADLNRQLHGLTLYCDGWAHDYVWLSVLFEAARLQPAFRLDDLRALLTEAETAHWDDTKAQVIATLHLQRHRASNDARILQQTLLRLRDPALAAAG